MATTTTLKIPEDLKSNIATIARAEGKTPHAWMVEALQTGAVLAQQRREFIDQAGLAAEEIDAGGPLYAHEDVAAFLRGKRAGKMLAKPLPVVEAKSSRKNRNR